MTRVLVNAVSAKVGGARTVVESLIAALAERPGINAIVLAGFPAPSDLPVNVFWKNCPRSGITAMLYSLFGVAITFRRYDADNLLSLNNTNCVLVTPARRLTYFHQLKALDLAFSEMKLSVIRAYMSLSRETVVVQTLQVRRNFENRFGPDQHDIITAWPGVTLPAANVAEDRDRRIVLVPITSPQSPHKNFPFVRAVAEGLGMEWRILVTAPPGLVDPGAEAGNIEFIGEQTRDRLFDLYQRACTVLFPSTHETIGLPIFEALGMGTPVIAHDAAYIRALRDDFGISSGLVLAATPVAAVTAIEAFGHSIPPVRYARDFTQANWNIVLDRLQEMK